MTSTKKDPVLVVLQLSGGNDGLNTIIPYGDPLYLDNRPNVRIPIDQVLPINDQIAFNPAMAPMKRLYDEGKVAIIQGVGYPNPSRSHFRSMDIWHTCEPDKVGDEGWLGRAVRDLDPQKENVLTGVNFGRGLPRSLVAPGVPVASVGNLETYGVLTGIEIEDQRAKALDVFSRVYSPMIGQGPVLDYFAHTGLDALEGADILSTAPAMYSSSVEYGGDTVAQYMRNIAQVHLANLGTRVFYTTAPYNSFDTHAGELLNPHQAVERDLRRDCRLLRRSERAQRWRQRGTAGLHRIRTPGSRQRLRTDHGSGGVAFMVGESVNGGLYGEYPSLETGQAPGGRPPLQQRLPWPLFHLLEKWMGLDAQPIVNGTFEHMAFI